VGRFASRIAEPLHEGANLAVKTGLTTNPVAQLQQFDAQPVVAVGATLDQAVLDQRRQDAKGGGGMQASGAGQGFEADGFVMRGKGVQQPGQPGDHLNRGSRFDGHWMS
jgi:hypothetical protein